MVDITKMTYTPKLIEALESHEKFQNQDLLAKIKYVCLWKEWDVRLPLSSETRPTANRSSMRKETQELTLNGMSQLNCGIMTERKVWFYAHLSRWQRGNPWRGIAQDLEAIQELVKPGDIRDISRVDALSNCIHGVRFLFTERRVFCRTYSVSLEGWNEVGSRV